MRDDRERNDDARMSDGRSEKNRDRDDARGDVRGDERDDRAKRESGQPGGGQGRRDTVGPTGVYPVSAGLTNDTWPKPDAEVVEPAAWGQGERGAEGYNDSGGSELTMRDGQLLGGLTAGPDGAPTIDIHGGDRPPEQGKGDQSSRKSQKSREQGKK